MSSDDKRHLGIIYDPTKKAGRMVDDLLALSRIGRQHLSKTEVDPNELVRLALRDLEPETKGRDIQLRIANLPAAFADSSLLRMVFQNLLANAVKYTGKKP